jgi:hypothetical protein
MVFAIGRGFKQHISGTDTECPECGLKFHSCGTRDNQPIKCWTNDEKNQLSYGEFIPLMERRTA